MSDSIWPNEGLYLFSGFMHSNETQHTTPWECWHLRMQGKLFSWKCTSTIYSQIFPFCNLTVISLFYKYDIVTINMAEFPRYMYKNVE